MVWNAGSYAFQALGLELRAARDELLNYCQFLVGVAGPQLVHRRLHGRVYGLDWRNRLCL